jgi:hypothetical protein
MKLSLIMSLFKRSGVCLKETRGLRTKIQDDGLILWNLRVSYAKLPREGVSGTLERAITSGRLRLDLTVERAASANRWARGVSDPGQGWQAGPCGKGAGEGSGTEQLDLHQMVEIRSVLIKSDHQISDGRPRSNSRRPVMGAVAPLDPATRSRRRRGGRHWQGSMGLGKGSGAFRTTWRTRLWASHRRGGTRVRGTRRGGLTAARIHSSEELRGH